MLNLKVVLVAWDVFMNADLWLRCSVVFDLHLEVKRCDSLKRDWNDFFTFRLPRAVAVSLSWLIEACAWTRVNGLLDCDRREMFAGVVISRVGQFLEGVFVGTGLGGLRPD